MLLTCYQVHSSVSRSREDESMDPWGTSSTIHRQRTNLITNTVPHRPQQLELLDRAPPTTLHQPDSQSPCHWPHRSCPRPRNRLHVQLLLLGARVCHRSPARIHAAILRSLYQPKCLGRYSHWYRWRGRSGGNTALRLRGSTYRHGIGG